MKTNGSLIDSLFLKSPQTQRLIDVVITCSSDVFC